MPTNRKLARETTWDRKEGDRVSLPHPSLKGGTTWNPDKYKT
jgi:hypothetical protein